MGEDYPYLIYLYYHHRSLCSAARFSPGISGFQDSDRECSKVIGRNATIKIVFKCRLSLVGEVV